MRPWMWTISIASMLAFSFAASAADYGSVSSGTGSAPPVAQSLMREGDFAINLAAALGFGTPTTETEAEDLLAKADIAPSNGWLSDYPMTPQIMGQLEEAISRSAAQGKLSMSSDQAVAVLHATASQLDLPIPAEQAPAISQTAPEAPQIRPNQQVINNYYYDAGPPIVTYYPPPYGYVYLYDWVPYPVWWYGFWFPGFYICNDFTTVIVYQTRPVIVSNHFHDHHSGTVGRVDPRGHHGGGHDGRPQSELRAAGGARYLTLADVRRGVRTAGPSGEGWKRPGERTFTGTYRHREPKAGRGAGEMYSRNMRVPLPDDSAVHNPSRGGAREGLRGYPGHAVDRPPVRPYAAGERGRYVPSRRYAPAPVMRESHAAWSGRVARSPGAFGNAVSSSSVARGHGSFSATGSRGGYGGSRSRM